MSLLRPMTSNSFEPDDRSWLYIPCAVIGIHCALIGWGVIFDSSPAMLTPKAPSRLVVQTVHLEPSFSKNSRNRKESQQLTMIEPTKEAEQSELVAMVEQTLNRVPEKKTESEVALNPNPLPPNPIKKNPLPATPITKTPLPPTPLERKTMAPPPKQEASKPAIPVSPPTPASASKSPAPSVKAAEKTPIKTAVPPKTPPPKNPFLEKRAAKLAEDKAAAAKKKQETEAAAAKKKEAEAAAKKKQEVETTKKKEAEQLAEQVRQQKLLADVQESIAKIGGNRDKVTPNKTGSRALAALPNAITSLQIDTLPAAKGGPSLSPREMTYRDELAGRLKLSLRLPEYGDVKVNVTLNREGKVVKLVIVNAESQANCKYIEKTLPGVSFPAFGNNFASAAEYTFSITLSNE